MMKSKNHPTSMRRSSRARSDDLYIEMEEDAAEEDEEDEQTVERTEKIVKVVSLRAYQLRDYEKTVMYGRLPIILLWMVSLTLLCILSGVSTASSYNVLFHLEHAHHEELELERFHKVTTPKLLWQWIRSTAKHLWLRDITPQNYPLGYFLLRQYRVSRDRFSPDNMISPDFKALLPGYVFPDWANNEASREPYGPGLQYIPNSMVQNPISVLTVSTEFHSYDDPADAFTIPVSMTTDLSSVLQQIDDLEVNKWVDNSTRIVIIDILTYNPSVGSFAGNHLFVEFFATGSSSAASKAYPFQILNLDTHFNRFLLAMDCGVILGTIVVMLQMFSTIHTNYQLGEIWISAWEIYDSFIIGFIITAYTFRLWMWIEGPILVNSDEIPSASQPNLAMFTSLFQYGYKYERSSTYLAVAITMVWLRFLRVLQHTGRLGVLSLTIKYAAGELFSLMVIYIVVLTGYALGATALFGADFSAMSSIQNSIGYLLRLTISAEIGADWDRLSEIHPAWVWPFMGSFMTLCWLILLNMVLAIVSGSFAAVQHAMGGKVASWGFQSILTDFKKMRNKIFGKTKGRSSQQGSRRSAIHILNTHIKANGLKSVVSYGEWQHLVNDIYTAQQALEIFNKADKDPATRVLPSAPGTLHNGHQRRVESYERESLITIPTTTRDEDEELQHPVSTYIPPTSDHAERLRRIETELRSIHTVLATTKGYSYNEDACHVCGNRVTMPFCGVTGERHGAMKAPNIVPFAGPAVGARPLTSPVQAPLPPSPNHGPLPSPSVSPSPYPKSSSTNNKSQIFSIPFTDLRSTVKVKHAPAAGWGRKRSKPPSSPSHSPLALPCPTCGELREPASECPYCPSSSSSSLPRFSRKSRPTVFDSSFEVGTPTGSYTRTVQ
eukprot:TRINITY_DN3543_c3_g1_i1.p1 TRINITY_DN3543_c3_g1~~TRINITY_DN3543_c3_g1_i1.p1  ORF type:complete len:891 (+),score=70.81 TRINITY_DN3543_c3_g1_i1:63-2735(+)